MREGIEDITGGVQEIARLVNAEIRVAGVNGDGVIRAGMAGETGKIGRQVQRGSGHPKAQGG